METALPPALYIEIPSIIGDDQLVRPGAVEAVKRWVGAHGVVGGFNFWPGIVDGLVGADTAAFYDRCVARHFEGLLSPIVWCLHSQAQLEPVLSECNCRKPFPGLLFMCREHLMAIHGPISHPGSMVVGMDSETRQMADSFNVGFQLVDEWLG